VNTAARTDQTPASSGPVALVLQPTTGSANITPDTAVTAVANNGTLTSVSLVEQGSTQSLQGDQTSDDRKWIYTGGLDSGATYTLTASAKGANGQTTNATSTFSTLQSDKLTVTVTPSDGDTVGVGAPVFFRFNTAIPDNLKANVVAHLAVRSSPPVAGGFHWFADDQVDFRPAQYWQPGTQVAVIAQLVGVNAGNGVWGQGNFSENFTIGDSHISYIDNNTLQMTVTSNGQTLYEWPVSMGRDSVWPTISGTLDVRYKSYKVHMDSESIGICHSCVGGYNEDVYWDTAISTDGFFVHAAPWSVGDQGVDNVSHGCVNLSIDRATTFFNFSQTGDVVIIVNTKRNADASDGEGDWNIPFSQFQPGGQSVSGYDPSGQTGPRQY